MSNKHPTGTLKSAGTLNGTIYMPREKEVLKLANAPQIREITLLASAWEGEDKHHSQIVEVEDVTYRSQVDLTPDDQQLTVFYEKDITFVTKNKGGEVTVIAIGQKPTNNYTMQAKLTELDVPEGTTIWGVTVGTPMRPETIIEKGLPTVTDKDEGKALKVQGGKWIPQEDESAEALSNLEIEKILNNFT